MNNRIVILTTKVGPLPYSAAIGLLNNGFDVTILVMSREGKRSSLLSVYRDYGVRYIANRVSYLLFRFLWIKFNNKSIKNIPVKTIHANNWDNVLYELHHIDPLVILTASCAFKLPVERFKFNCHLINLHPAPLPGWRGADPIFWMSLLKIKKIGFSLHELIDKFDQGDLYCVELIDARKLDFFGRGEISIAELVKQRLAKNVKYIVENSISATPQDQGQWWPMPTKLNQKIVLERLLLPVNRND